MKKINSRRYIGCKTKLLEDIYDLVIERGFDNNNCLADVFSGTGSVGDFFARKGYSVIFNDNLFSNYVAYQGFYGNGNIDNDKINSYIDYFNSIEYSMVEENYFSKIYGNRYFSINDAKKIGFIRDFIENKKEELTEREYYYLITCLVYSIDSKANTVGHYESYLKKRKPEDTNFRVELIENIKVESKICIYNEDANLLAKHIKCDIAYIDPPYNARQYINFYHVLENLCRWNKPEEFEGDSMKFKRNELKSGYCRNNKAPQLFEDLISTLNCKLIIVSYNNTYSAKSVSSNNTISEQEIISSLEKRGKVTKKEINYKAFNTGKTELTNHKEYLFVCECEE